MKNFVAAKWKIYYNPIYKKQKKLISYKPKFWISDFTNLPSNFNWLFLEVWLIINKPLL